MLARIVRAKYRKGPGKGHFEPIEPVDLAEDEVVEVIVPEVRRGDRERFLRSAGAWKDLVPEDIIARLRERRAVPRERPAL
jgi:predicted DNA-binding antitoxin AbrB/MazE fold protein